MYSSQRTLRSASSRWTKITRRRPSRHRCKDATSSPRDTSEEIGVAGWSHGSLAHVFLCTLTGAGMGAVPTSSILKGRNRSR